MLYLTKHKEIRRLQVKPSLNSSVLSVWQLQMQRHRDAERVCKYTCAKQYKKEQLHSY